MANHSGIIPASLKKSARLRGIRQRAIKEHGAAVRKGRREGDIMRSKQNRHVQPVQHLSQKRLPRWVKPFRGFIEQQHIRAAKQKRSKGRPLLLSTAEIIRVAAE